MKILNKIKKIIFKTYRFKNWLYYYFLYKQYSFKISRNEVLDSDIHYFMESPELLTKILNVDFNNLPEKSRVIASFSKPDGLSVKFWYNNTKVHAVLDNFCSMPKKFDNSFTRLDKCLLVRSNKNYLSGHKLRHAFTESEYLDIIDLNGNIDDLFTIYSKYKYVLVIENSLSPGYVSEKFFDAIKSGCYVIYYGCQDTANDLGFKSFSFINFTSPNDNDVQALFEDKFRNLIAHDTYSLKNTYSDFCNLEILRNDLDIEFCLLPSYFLMRGEF